MLVKEPYNLTLDDIRKLTPYQVRNIYFRDEEQDKPKQKRGQSYKEVFYSVWRRRGWREGHIDQKWAEYQREQEAARRTRK